MHSLSSCTPSGKFNRYTVFSQYPSPVREARPVRAGGRCRSNRGWSSCGGRPPSDARGRDAAALLHLEEGFHDVVHVYVALQVIGLVEVAFGVALGAAQVDEVDAVGKACHQGGAVVGAAYAEGAGAEAEAVALVGHGVYQRLEVLATTHDARQAEDGHGRVVGMDDELDAHFIGHGADFAQEVDEVLAEAFGRDVLVAVQFVLELLQREALFRAGQSGYHVADEALLVLIGHLLEAGFGLS